MHHIFDFILRALQSPIFKVLPYYMASQVELAVKNPPANAGDARDAGSIPGLGRSPRVGNGTPLQHSCLENPMNRGDWRTTGHRVAEHWTQLSMHVCVCACVHTHTHTHTHTLYNYFHKCNEK